MRIVVDTNIFVSAALKQRSLPNLALYQASRRCVLLKSVVTEAQFFEVIARPYLAPISFGMAIIRAGSRIKRIVMMTLPCRLSIFAFSVAASLCCHRNIAFGQSAPTPTNIVTKDVSCSFGILRIFDANVLIKPEEILQYQAWAAAREYGNGVRASICVDPEYALIGSKIKATIQKRVAEANACNAKQLSALQAANLSAATANTKLENQALANIRELIAFGKGRAELGDEATEGAEKGAEYLSGIASGGKALKPLAELAQLAGTGGGAAFLFSSEVIAEHIVDKGKELAVHTLNPYQIVGAMERAYLDAAYSERMSEVNSFSYTECQ